MSFDGTTGGYISTDPTATPIQVSNDISLAVQHWAKSAVRAGQKKLRTVGYSYQVLVSSRPLLEFHYHPSGAVKHCHVHVRADSKDWASLRKVHVATGRVALEDVLLMLIDDFELPPRKGARALLHKQRQAFDKRQTWGGAQPQS